MLRRKRIIPKHQLYWLISLWTPEERKKYINERISLHQNAQINYDLHNKLPLCSDDERWKKKDSWAVGRKHRKEH